MEFYSIIFSFLQLANVYKTLANQDVHCSDNQKRRYNERLGEYVCCFVVICTEDSNTYPVFCTEHNTSDRCELCPSNTCRVQNDLKSDMLQWFDVDAICYDPKKLCDLSTGTVLLDYSETCPACRCNRNAGYIRFNSESKECVLAGQSVAKCTGERNRHLWPTDEGVCAHCPRHQLRNAIGICSDNKPKRPEDYTRFTAPANPSNIPTTPPFTIPRGAKETVHGSTWHILSFLMVELCVKLVLKCHHM